MKRVARKGGAKSSLVEGRLLSQQIARHEFETPAEVVGWLGAVQGQDYGAAKWAVGLRLPALTEAGVERALAEGTVLRTHALRGTWQLVAPADIRWILALVAPRIIARNATRYRELALDEATFRRSTEALVKALGGGDHLTRVEVATALGAAGVSTKGLRFAYLMQRAELDALVCGGARRGKQPTYALLDRRAPTARARVEPDEALAELARRYFRSRGPATVDDFVWWSSLSPSVARAGLELVKSTLVSDVIGGKTFWRGDGPPRRAGPETAYLLPPFDEYLVAYRNRDAVLDPKHAKHHNAGGGTLHPCIVVDGRVIGTWRRVVTRTTVAIELDLFEAPSRRVRQNIAQAADRYGAFLGLKTEITGVSP
jgi:hypothetical protein